ncbi:hypothetical protein [Ensifer sp. SSB1]|jgi:hypothetical protein|uniref:hypothetical protein n=1 Tax=Ensifer sp. SSB1 TaxID=2795385 RepID=UPI000DE3A804|nr:hypothetical protein [Ensifer sp. SSB1]MBK5565858.1 hypothetical protein [Ensifer sp. SSB1]
MNNPLPDVTYYVLCVIEQPKSAAAVAIEVAFGQRDQVEFGTCRAEDDGNRYGETLALARCGGKASANIGSNVSNR